MEARPLAFGDVVLARKDVPSSYHLAVTVDDAEQGVTLVTRGEDLFEATHIHRLLQALLALPEPRYYHHNLIADFDRVAARQAQSRGDAAHAPPVGSPAGRDLEPARAAGTGTGRMMPGPAARTLALPLRLRRDDRLQHGAAARARPAGACRAANGSPRSRRAP